MDRILAIDSGLTVTKAVLFDISGRQIAVARRNVAQLKPSPRRIERDMAALWNETASAIRDVLAASNTDRGDVVAVAATAHGDGIYLLDDKGAPLGPGILSLDSRAVDVVADWQLDGTASRALTLTGQAPHVSAPSALLRWIRDHEPDRFGRIGHVLACKDWLRFCLSGQIGTDHTEISTSFTAVESQSCSDEALALYGLSALRSAIPQADHPATIIGRVTAEAALATGLAEGTPVAAGLHDVTASALGIGAHRPGVFGIVAGTYSINECVASQPKVDSRWYCRNAIEPGQWNHMSISPASTANYDWFLDTFCAAERGQTEVLGADIHARLRPEIEAALNRPSSILYHPYLFGSPMGAAPSAGFLGMRGWHDRGDVLAALLEGIAFNHRDHVDALRERFDGKAVRLTGGASRSPVVAQLFANILNMPVTVTDTDEAAAWGVALCAGAAVGAFPCWDADPRDLCSISTLYDPASDRAAHYERRYAVYRQVAENLMETWDSLNALEKLEREVHHD
ncbi:FGGY-family carbohydrate kinase [Marivita sp. XM-24bin2]|uniref:FGGY-family carbohydrate kinase n=1 Tax=Marivita sp. XM-24bin2 TaxID=2133951 RepID=UPI000D7B0D6C|nr:FGGY-family carbohydrate kinase [Marivita sp. XM-24bin2]PWL33429.1 MAG: carbohydrate kinase [Marivita sp. XM-24bin2]